MNSLVMLLICTIVKLERELVLHIVIYAVLNYRWGVCFLFRAKLLVHVNAFVSDKYKPII